MMSTFLFSAQPAKGHINPMLTIAHELNTKGHRVVFTAPTAPGIEQFLADRGVQFIGIRPAPSAVGLLLLSFTSGFTETFLASRFFFNGITYYARGITKVLEEIEPQAVVTDFSFLGAALAAELKDTPYVIVYHAGLSFPGPDIPPFASGLPIGGQWGFKGKWYGFLSNIMVSHVDKKIARARRRLKLPLAENGYLTRPSSPWLMLVLSSEASEAPRFALPSTSYFVGPCFAGREDADAGGFPFDRFSPGKPKVYVSLGTVFNKKPRVFKRIMDAFSDGRYQLIVSAGRAFAKLRSQSIPTNVLLFERVPQVEVLSRVDAVISHGGNNTVNETLAAGKPLLVMPVGGEQGDNASRVVYLGAGLRANIKEESPLEIGAKVDRLIKEPAFRQRVQEIAESLAQSQGAATAARFIEHIAQSRQPLERPNGYPLTVTRDSGPPWEYRGG
jgi:UDP:flavonoid glycosyltransferase YjiC (YdhE family)